MLSSSDGWAAVALAAQLPAEENAQAAAVVTRGDSVYALYRRFTLPADDSATPSISTAIVRLALDG